MPRCVRVSSVTDCFPQVEWSPATKLAGILGCVAIGSLVFAAFLTAAHLEESNLASMNSSHSAALAIAGSFVLVLSLVPSVECLPIFFEFASEGIEVLSRFDTDAIFAIFSAALNLGCAAGAVYGSSTYQALGLRTQIAIFGGVSAVVAALQLLTTKLEKKLVAGAPPTEKTSLMPAA